MKRFSKKFRRRSSSGKKQHGQQDQLETDKNGRIDGLPNDFQQKSSENNIASSSNLYDNDRASTAKPDFQDYSLVDSTDNVFQGSSNLTNTNNLYSSVGSTVDDAVQHNATHHQIIANNSNNCQSKESMRKNNSSVSQPIMQEFQKLAKKGWYWGPLTREQAERKLCNTPEASFLVRDSSDDRYLLSLSFRSNSRTLHTRIEHSGMRFSFYEDSPSQAYTSVIELIENSIRDSNEQGVFCYSRSRQPNAQTFPVRLMHPVSRFTEVRPLQDLCRFVIRQYTRVDHIQNLPVPRQIKGYLNQSYF